MNANKRYTDAVKVDPDDAPELTDTFFERADEFKSNRLVRRDWLKTYTPSELKA
nr:hypothetical protein [uncultured Pseudomonas sp.]